MRKTSELLESLSKSYEHSISASYINFPCLCDSASQLTSPNSNLIQISQEERALLIKYIKDNRPKDSGNYLYWYETHCNNGTTDPFYIQKRRDWLNYHIKLNKKKENEEN